MAGEDIQPSANLKSWAKTRSDMSAGWDDEKKITSLELSIIMQYIFSSKTKENWSCGWYDNAANFFGYLVGTVLNDFDNVWMEVQVRLCLQVNANTAKTASSSIDAEYNINIRSYSFLQSVPSPIDLDQFYHTFSKFQTSMITANTGIATLFHFKLGVGDISCGYISIWL